MTQDEAISIYKSNYNKTRFYMNYGIDILVKKDFNLLVDEKLKLLLIFKIESPPQFEEVVYFNEIINLQFDSDMLYPKIIITYKREGVTKEFSFSKSGFYSRSKFEKFYLKLLSYFTTPLHKNSDGTYDLTQVEMKAMYHAKKYHIFDILISHGINAFATENYCHMIYDTLNKNLIFFTTHFFISDSVAHNVGAVLSIDKITKVEFGDRNSPLSQKGSEPKSLNILITYKSNDIEKEILFSHIGMNSYLFENLYTELHSYISEPIKLNDKGVFEL